MCAIQGGKKAHQQKNKNVKPLRNKKPEVKPTILKKDQELPEQKVLALKGLPLFHELSYRELLNIIEIIELKIQKKGELVIREHESGSKMFILLKGMVQVHKGGKKLARLQRGQWFGDWPADDECQCSLTPTALSQNAFNETHSKEPETGVKIFHAISKR